jgi:hypothetical protein
MATNKVLKKKDRKFLIPKHPLVKLAGKFEGEFWESPLDEIQRFRDKDKEEVNKTLNYL